MEVPHQFVRVFGGAAVLDAGEPVSIGGPRQRRLLALLAARPDHVVSIDWLAEHLWDDHDRPDDTEPALRTYVSRLRRALPTPADGWIQTEAAGYRFTAPAEAIDVRRFGLLRAEARRARDRDDHESALGLLDEALSLWQGEPYRELENLDWARADAEQLRLDRLEMLEERWEAALALGRHTQITGELATFTAEHGLRDRAARQYALALHRSGRTAEALQVISAHRGQLAEESGLDPSAGIVELEQQLLAGDPSLDVDQVGRRLRGYRLLEEIGSGAFSVVWRGVQPSVNREVAIKQIRSELASRPEFIRRFEAEAHLVARVEHPHIVPLIDYWRDPDSAYLVMRWLRGGTLEQRLDGGPLPIDSVVTIARQIGGALSAAHARGIVHRDVKGANVLFDEDGHAFLSDFGIALEVAESSGPEAALSPGSPAYASPEQIRQEPLGPQADIFSLGVVLFEAIAGELPFRSARSARKLVELQLDEPFPPLGELRSDVPATVADAVARATAKDPSDRFASVAEFVDALAAAPAFGATPGRPASAETTVGRDALAVVVGNPYRGLRAFDDSDADRFFGRDGFVHELTQRWHGNADTSRCLAVVGPSGSGKSSVVRAGFVPALRSGAVPGSDDWFVTTMVPGANAYESLEAALLRVAVNPPPSLLSQLTDGPRGFLRAARRCLPGEDGTVVVLIDQFEELFVHSAEIANDFLDALSVAVTEPSSSVRFVLTLRADFYGRPLEHPNFARIFTESSIDVTPLAPNELEQAIVEPARQVGVEFEPGLVARIAADTFGQTSPLPLLQYALAELFERRDGNLLTLAAYDDLGGLSGALAARSESVYAGADDDQRAAVRRLFGALTDPSEASADVRRRARLADLGDDPAMAWALDEYGAARLLAFDADVATREPMVEVAHEALFREWPRLVQWLDEDIELLRTVDAIGTAATVWDQGGRTDTDLYRGGRLDTASQVATAAPDRLRPVDVEFVDASRAAAAQERAAERHRVRRLRWLVAGVGVALVIALVAGTVALVQRNRARVATDDAEVATLISRASAVGADDPELSVLLALEAHRRAPGPETEQAVLDAMVSNTSAEEIASVPIVEEMFEDGCGLTLPAGAEQLFYVNDAQLMVADTVTAETQTLGATPNGECVTWIGREDLDRRVAFSPDMSTMWIGSYDGTWDVEHRFDAPVESVFGTDLNEARVLLVQTTDGDVASAVLLDSSTGDQIGEPVEGKERVVAGALDESRGLVAAGFVDDLVVVIDADDGSEQFRVELGAQPQAMVFDENTGELVVGTFAGDVVTIDVATGAVTSVVEIRGNQEILHVGLAPDGELLVTFFDGVQRADRRTGPIGRMLDLPASQIALVRDDGTISVVPEDASALLTYRVASSILATDTIEFNGPASLSFGGGQVVVANELGAELIDLATTERTALELFNDDGSPFPAVVATPGPEGVLALSGEGEVFVWRDGERTDGLDLSGGSGGFLATGHNVGPHHFIITVPPDGPPVGYSLLLDDGQIEILAEVEIESEVAPAVGADLGFHLFGRDGTVLSYDRDGELVSELTTEFGWAPEEFPGRPGLDPATGRVAVGAGNQLIVVDAATGETTIGTLLAPVIDLAFSPGGESLLVGSTNGSVRLWDIGSGQTRATLWRGDTSIEPGSWLDTETNSLWVTGRGELIQLSLDPSTLIGRACEFVGRDLTPEEWEAFVPGGGDVQSACS